MVNGALFIIPLHQGVLVEIMVACSSNHLHSTGLDMDMFGNRLVLLGLQLHLEVCRQHNQVHLIKFLISLMQ